MPSVMLSHSNYLKIDILTNYYVKTALTYCDINCCKIKKETTKFDRLLFVIPLGFMV